MAVAAPPPDKPGGNTPSPLPNNPDQIILPDIDEGEGGSEGTGTKPTKTPIIDVNNSKLVQFTKKYAGATEFYVEMQESTIRTALLHVPSMDVLPGRVRTAM